MANKELIALLKTLQGSGAGSVLNPGLLAQLPALIAGAAEPLQAGVRSRGSVIASAASLPSLFSGSPKPSLAEAGSRGSAIASAASTVASSALRGVSGGLTLLPVVSSLLKLFGVGRKKEELPALEKFDLPAPIRAEAGLSQSGETFLIDRGVGDRIRQLPAPAGSTPFARAQTASPQPGAGASITVNVQAMDSQSFMDRREDIARAVREAMLQSHSLNDVVSEL